MESLCEKYNLNIIRIKGDGNCFYRAISQNLFNTQDKHLNIRFDIAGYIQTHANEIGCFLENEHSVNSLCSDILTPGTYGGEIDIYVAVRFYNVRIIVYSLNLKPLVYEPEGGNPDKTWHLIFDRNMKHYDSASIIVKNLAIQNSGINHITNEEHQNSKCCKDINFKKRKLTTDKIVDDKNVINPVNSNDNDPCQVKSSKNCKANNFQCENLSRDSALSIKMKPKIDEIVDNRKGSCTSNLIFNKSRKRSNILETGKKYFKCTACASAFTEAWILKRHQSSKICKVNILPQENIRDGSSKCGNFISRPSYSCDTCCKTFSTAWVLKRHQNSIHCKKKALAAQDRLEAVKSYGVSHLSYSDCDKSSESKCLIDKPGDIFVCDSCSKTFSKAWILKRHQSSKHCKISNGVDQVRPEAAENCDLPHFYSSDYNESGESVNVVNPPNDIFVNIKGISSESQDELADIWCHNFETLSNETLESSNYKSIIIKEYFRAISEGPDCICCCCGGLWFRKSVVCFANYDYLVKFSKVFVNTVCRDASIDIKWICKTCNNSLSKGEVPKLALSNGLDFNIVPSELQGLTPTEERLVSARIPFMQIKTLGCDKQYSMKGNVVNVPVDISTTTSCLPRRFSESHTVQLKLMRRMHYKKPYIYESVRPLKVYKAAKYLISQPLYKEFNVLLSNDWLSLFDSNEVVDFDVEYSEKNISNDKENLDCLLVTDMTPSVEIDTWEEICDDSELLSIGNKDSLLLENDENITLEFAPCENQTPLSLIADEYCEELSFPTIYCGRKRQINALAKLTYGDIAKSELRRYDRRCADISKIFFMYKKLEIIRVLNSVSICLRKAKGLNGQYTAGCLLDSAFVSNIIQNDEGFRVLKQIRSSPAYWEAKKKDLMAKIRQLGVPNFFFTFSAAESKWVELHEILYKIVNGHSLDKNRKLTFKEVAELVQKDPVTTARYFEHRFSIFFRNIIVKLQTLGEVTDFYYRVEMQSRGSCHIHGFLWTSCKMPDYNSSESVRDLENYIDGYITCHRPPEGDFRQLVNYQQHKHTKTCKRTLNNVNRCRFGIPYPPMAETRILEPLTEVLDDHGFPDLVAFGKLKSLATSILAAISEINVDSDNRDFSQFFNSLNITSDEYIKAIQTTLKRTTLLLKRRPCEIRTNAYNKTLLELWKANLDIQPVLDAYSCAQYIVSYVGKSLRGMSKTLKDACDESSAQNMTIKQKLKFIANKFLNCTEMSAQEAVFHIMSIPLSSSSRAVIFINTGKPDERVQMKKFDCELKLLDKDSTDVTMKGVLDYYVLRPDSMEKVCLADFAACYSLCSNNKNVQNLKLFPEENKIMLKDNSHFLMERTKPKIIRYRRYNILQSKEDFYREMLMLYLPWRNEQVELLDILHEDKYKANISLIHLNRKKYVFGEIEEKIDEAISGLQNECEDLDNHNSLEEPNLTTNEFVAFDAETSLNTVPELEIAGNKECLYKTYVAPKMLQKDERLNLLMTLNEQQKMVFLHVLNFFKTCKNNEFMNLFITGGAGTGKSLLIRAIYQSLVSYFNTVAGSKPDLVKVLLTAPTGKASFNIEGKTLHSSFGLPINQFSGEMPALSPDIANTYSAQFQDLKVVIIDEISMVGSKMLHQIDKRLKQIMRNCDSFGGVSIIAVGDFKQLPPVADAYAFEIGKWNNPYSELAGPVLWQKFSYIELTEIMRQKDDKIFAIALNNLSSGNLTDDEIVLFKSRQFIENDPAIPNDAIRLFSRNIDVDLFNDRFLQKLPGKDVVSQAFDLCLADVSPSVKVHILNSVKHASAVITAGLRSRIVFKIGALYMLTVNVDTNDGLVNGAIGTLKHIDFGGDNIPVRIWILFPNENVGRSARSRTCTLAKQMNLENCTLISPVCKTFSRKRGSTNIKIARKQFPVVPSQAITVHKSQGDTYEKVVVHLRKGMLRSALYVACSRAKSASGLFLIGEFLVPKQPSVNDRVVVELNRLKNKCPLVYGINFLHKETISCIRILFHNICSLVKHFEHVLNDQSFMCCDILIFAETNFRNNTCVDLQFFTLLCSVIHNGIRASCGSAVYIKNSVFYSSSALHCSELFFSKGHIETSLFQFLDFKFLSIYKSPHVRIVDFLNHLDFLFSNFQLRSVKLLCVGDFNVSFQELTQIKVFFSKYAMQLKTPEVPSTNFGSCLDLVFSNIDVLAGYYESYFSDHKPVWIVIPT